jgi:hypothetical protein
VEEVPTNALSTLSVLDLVSAAAGEAAAFVAAVLFVFFFDFLGMVVMLLYIVGSVMRVLIENSGEVRSNRWLCEGRVNLTLKTKK